MKTFHVHLSVRGALRWPKNKLKKLFRGAEADGHQRYLDAEEAREFLMDQLASGVEALSFGDCGNFDIKEGCRGHHGGSEGSI